MDRQFGRYVLLRKLGSGGMGEVYLAKLTREEGFEKLCCLKCIRPQLTKNRRFVTLFISEAKISAQLNHENVVQVYDFGRIGDTYYIAMEYVEGTDLKKLLAKAREAGRDLPFRCAAAIAAGCLRGLDYAHRREDANGRTLNIVHCDVSPQNILLSTEGAVKVTDFGLSRAMGNEGLAEGQIGGKVSYMSPEQAAAGELDCRADLYSLGVVIRETLSCGRAAEREWDEGGRFAAGPAGRVVMKAVRPDRAARYSSAREMLSALDAAAAECGGMASKEELSALVRELAPAGAARDTAVAWEPTMVSAEPDSAGGALRSASPGAGRRRRLAALLAAAAAAAGIGVAGLFVLRGGTRFEAERAAGEASGMDPAPAPEAGSAVVSSRAAEEPATEASEEPVERPGRAAAEFPEEKIAAAVPAPVVNGDPRGAAIEAAERPVPAIEIVEPALFEAKMETAPQLARGEKARMESRWGLGIDASMDAAVYLDGKERGSVPASGLILGEGSYTVRLRPSGGEFDFFMRFDFDSQREYASVNLDSRPWAELRIEGEREEPTPVTGLRFGGGKHEVEFKLRGEKDYRKIIVELDRQEVPASESRSSQEKSR